MTFLIKKAGIFLTNPVKRFDFLNGRGFYRNMDDREFLKKSFRLHMSQALDLENPMTFNEKLQWLKLYDRRPEYTMMVDKYLVREYIAEMLGEEYLIPLLGVWDAPEEINFDALPEQFVLKCNHNSGRGMCICRDKSKLDIQKVKRELKKGLQQDYYLPGREWPYKDVPRKIICEKYMVDASTAELRDYKFFCFGGEVRCYKVDFDRFVCHHANYFTADGKRMKFGEVICPPDSGREIQVSANIGKMRKFAEKLSAKTPFLRVDFYDVNGKIYFGELTFFPASGFGKFLYDGNDEMLGSWLELPEMGDCIRSTI